MLWDCPEGRIPGLAPQIPHLLIQSTLAHLPTFCQSFNLTLFYVTFLESKTWSRTRKN